MLRAENADKLRLSLLPIAINEVVTGRWMRCHASLDVAARDRRAVRLAQYLSAGELAATRAHDCKQFVVLLSAVVVAEKEAQKASKLKR